MSKKCKYCGARLKDGVCEFCGYTEESAQQNVPNISNVSDSNYAPPRAGYTPPSSRYTPPASYRATPTSTPRSNPRPASSAKKFKPLIIIFGLIVAFIALICLINYTPLTAQVDGLLNKKSSDLSDKYSYVSYALSEAGDNFTQSLSSGNYIVGVDLPEGTYELHVLKGDGNIDVDSQKNSIYISESLDVEEGKYAVSSLYDLRLYQDSQISIEGVTVELKTANAQTDKMQTPPSNTATEETEFSAILVAGKDFEPGVYDIVALEGTGQVSVRSTSNSSLYCYLSAEADRDYPALYKNVEFTLGATLELSSLKVKLVPSSRGVPTAIQEENADPLNDLRRALPDVSFPADLTE